MIVTDDNGQASYGHAIDCAHELEQRGVVNAEHLVYNWIRRRRLTKVGDFEGRPVYAMADVLRVESATRRNGKRGRRLTLAMAMTEHLQ